MADTRGAFGLVICRVTNAGPGVVWAGFPFAYAVGMPYSPLLMETNTKSVLTDLQAFDVASLKGRLIELRRYL